MNEDTSFKKETSKLGIDASTPDETPVNPVEPSISSARPETGSLPDAALPANLVWPPLRDDLKRLYLDQGLSAMKIAKIYDLKYANPKTAESTVLHHLKKHGITRREPAHISKVTDATADEWVQRYQKGESLNQIAGGALSPVTVFNHLHKRGLQLRDKVEAQIEAVTKFEKRPFSGDRHEMAYITGIAIGDYATTRHGRAIRARLSTTHPAMARLFRGLFEKHGPIYEYPHKAKLTEFEWCLDCDLDESFTFLLDLKKTAREVLAKDDLFLDFLAGFFDAEGSIYYHSKHRWGGAFELGITNTNEELLRKIATMLEALGISTKLARIPIDPQRALERGIKNAGEFIWRLNVWRADSVKRLLQWLPLRHPEKVAKAAIALRLEPWPTMNRRLQVLAQWEELLDSIDLETKQYVARAREAWQTKNPPAGNNLGP